MIFQNYLGASVDVTVDQSRDALLTDFGKATLKDRYTLRGEDFQGMFARVAAYYSDDTAMAQRMYDYISQHWFMPSTPILSNGGTDRGMPISCFINAVDDSLESIDATWSENVWLAARGGGIGTSWSNVRSIKEKIGDVGETSGIIPFIKVQDSLTLGISQGSLRRGSAAVYLDISHPEIEEFIDIRRPQGGDHNRKSLNVHHGIMISDAFMEAMLAGKKWDLISPKDGSVRKTVKARELWQKILTTRLETGEPYIVFSDTVNRMRPEVYKKNDLFVSASNLCSEIMLHTGVDYMGLVRTAVCCLSSYNLFHMDEWFGNTLFIKDTHLFLDNVLQDFIRRTEGVKGFENARYAASMERSIGLGVMGYASYLQEHGIHFESALAKAVNLKAFKWLRKVSDEVNHEVALERGPCPDAAHANLMVRWSHTFAIAPTASISIITGTVSPCTEPYPANVFTQKTLSGSFEVRNGSLDKVLRAYAETLHDQWQEDTPEARAAAVEVYVNELWKDILKHEGSVQHLTILTPDQRKLFKTWEEVDQRWVISHAADRAPFIDQAASNNLFLPADCHKRDLHKIHVKAWKDGVPSLYYLRSKSLQRAVSPSHVAGELPTAATPKTYELQEQEAVTDYEECLACQ